MEPTHRHLVVIRHAKSDWSAGLPDAERPLNKRGMRDARAAGRWLASLPIAIDGARVSPATRTRQTWDLLAGEAGVGVVPKYERGIYLGEAGDLAQVVRELPPSARAAVLVGHSPGCEEFVEWASGGQGEEFALDLMREKFPTAGAAWLTVDGPWADLGAGSARLVHFEVCRG